MTTRVEELRARLMNSIGLYGVESDKAMPTEMALALDSLIAAARQEGAEVERERIWMARHDVGAGDPAAQNERVALIPVVAFRGVSDPLLAPAPKEDK